MRRFGDRLIEERKVRIVRKMDTVKAVITAVLSFLSGLLGVLYIPVGLLVACNLIDYITGLMAVPSRAEKVSSYKSMRGILKKICMWLLVIVGAILDQLIKCSAQTIGLEMPFTFLVACIVAIWLVCNELISILENISDIGVPMPAFLRKIVIYIKDQTEIEFEDKESEEEK